MRWDPGKYTEFRHHRDRPFFDLVSRIGAATPKRVVDLGCGPSTLTATLAERWPGAAVIGLDSSPAMIDRARSLSDAPTNLRFVQADIAGWQPDADVDVVVSNAAFQWVPDHARLIRGWLGRLAPGSWFAFQVPGNFRSPSHTLMRQLAEGDQWRARLGGVLRHDDAVLDPADYLTLFLEVGWLADVWETTYLQLLPGDDPVLEWVRGTGLRPILGALGDGDARAFEAQYAGLLRAAYPPTARGTVFPFRRIFCVGHKPFGN